MDRAPSRRDRWTAVGLRRGGGAGRAIIEGDGTIATAVAVRHPKPEETDRELAVVSPCGACREMIRDHDPEALVIVPGAAGPEKLPIRALLPLPYRR